MSAKNLILLSIIFIFFNGCRFLPKKNPTPRTDKNQFIEQIKSVECGDEMRLRSVYKLLERIGINDAEMEVEKFDNVANVVLTVKGKTD